MTPATLLPVVAPSSVLTHPEQACMDVVPEVSFENLLHPRNPKDAPENVSDLDDASGGAFPFIDCPAPLSEAVAAARSADSESVAASATPGVCDGLSMDGVVEPASENAGNLDRQTETVRRQKQSTASDQAVPSRVNPVRNLPEGEPMVRPNGGNSQIQTAGETSEAGSTHTGKELPTNYSSPARPAQSSQESVQGEVKDRTQFAQDVSTASETRPIDGRSNSKSEKVGKIDPANPAEIGRAALAKNGPPARMSASDADEYRVRGRSTPTGTPHAKRLADMKFAPAALVDDPAATVVRETFSRARSDQFPRGEALPVEGVRLARSSAADPSPTIGSEGFLTSAMSDASGVGNAGTSATPSMDRPAIHAALRILHAGIERCAAKPSAAAGLDLELPMEDGAPVRVRLHVGGGEVRAVIRTDSVELRNALEQAWPQLAQRCQDRGVALGEARFQPMESRDFGGDAADSRHPREWKQDDSQPRRPSKSASSLLPLPSTTPRRSLSLWA